MAAADDHLREVPVASQPVFDGRLLHVRLDTVRLPDGGMVVDLSGVRRIRMD